VERGSRARRVGAAAVEAALEAGEPLRVVVVAAGAELSAPARAAVERAGQTGVPVVEVGSAAHWRLTAGAPGVELLGLVGPPADAPLEAVLALGGAVWLLVGTAYPGNAGFVIRTAEVSGADGVVIDAAFDRAGRREAVRAAMRADRYLPCLFEPWRPVADAARRAGHRLIAVETSGDRAPWEVDLRGPVLFAVGGEHHGLPAPLLERADAVVRLPMCGFLPSYNLQAAMAATATERLRQQP